MPIFLYVIIGVIVLAACCGAKKQSGQKKALRVNHPHYYDPDEFECTVCGAKFQKTAWFAPSAVLDSKERKKIVRNLMRK